MNNYALPPGEIVLDGDLIGMGEHTDYGIVTVLWADQVRGLQVLAADGSWNDVSPLPGALLVNLGDLTNRWTNERWKSTLHRVKPPIVDGTIKRRRSAAFFHDGNIDAVISALPVLRGRRPPAALRPGHRRRAHPGQAQRLPRRRPQRHAAPSAKPPASKPPPRLTAAPPIRARDPGVFRGIRSCHPAGPSLSATGAGAPECPGEQGRATRAGPSPSRTEERPGLPARSIDAR